MILAVGCFALMDACLKQLAASYPFMQVNFLRNAVSLPLVVLTTWWLGEWRDLKPVRLGLHALRGVLSVIMLWVFIYALSELSLADAYSIFLSAPLLVTALSLPILKEPVGWHRWLAVCVGLCGVLLMLRPAAAGVATLGGLAAFAAAVFYALSVNLIRLASRTDTAAATIVWQLLVTAFVSGVLAIAQWVTVRTQDWWWVMALGVTGTLGQYFITQAFRRAPAAVVAPFEYTSLLWAMLLDWLVWQAWPNPLMAPGAAVVIGSGLYVIYRERRRQLSPA